MRTFCIAALLLFSAWGFSVACAQTGTTGALEPLNCTDFNQFNSTCCMGDTCEPCDCFLCTGAGFIPLADGTNCSLCPALTTGTTGSPLPPPPPPVSEDAAPSANSITPAIIAVSLVGALLVSIVVVMFMLYLRQIPIVVSVISGAQTLSQLPMNVTPATETVGQLEERIRYTFGDPYLNIYFGGQVWTPAQQELIMRSPNGLRDLKLSELGIQPNQQITATRLPAY